MIGEKHELNLEGDSKEKGTNLLHQHKNTGHNTTARVHNFELPAKDKRNYILRMHYTKIY